MIVRLGLTGVLLVGSGQALAAALAGMRREQDPASVMDLYRINLKSGYQAERLIANGLARVAHESPNVRGTAADCVRDESDSLADPKAALELVLDQLEKETAPDASMELSYAVTALDPVKRGLGDRTLAVVKKMHAKEQAGTGEVLGALGIGKTPPNGAVDLALEILKTGKGPVESSIEVLESAKARQADACKALLEKVKTGKYLWSRAMNGNKICALYRPAK